MHVATIQSGRLDLVSMSPAFMRASLEGRLAEAENLLGAELPADWPGVRARTLRMRLDDLAANPAARPWLLRAMVLRQPDRRLVGHIGFHDPPGPDGTVEVGYSVWPEYQRRGYAYEAVTALFAWAASEHDIRQFVASVGPWNAPSLGLVRKLGFVQTGRQWDDEDGEELVFVLDRCIAPPAAPC
jgi:[ribosomal protein S5]-alanine N-acetyltransferase